MPYCPQFHPLSRTSQYHAGGASDAPAYYVHQAVVKALIQQIFAHSLEEVDTFQVDFWVRDTRTLLQMVAGDVGVSLVPTLALNNQQKANVVTLPLSPRCDRTLIAFWPKRQPLNPVGKQLFKEC